MLSPAIRACIAGGDKQVTSFADVSEKALCAAVDASVDFVKKRLVQKHRRVKHAMKVRDQLQKEIEDDPGKFSIRKMASGLLEDFHKGLTDRIGEKELCALCVFNHGSQSV